MKCYLEGNWLKLYTHAVEEIQRYLRALHVEHGFSEEEIYCYPIEVIEGPGKDRVVFEIHTRLKQNIEEVYQKGTTRISFKHSEKEKLCLLVIENGGVESYFFMRLLEKIIIKMQGSNPVWKEDNLETIRRAIRAAISKADEFREQNNKCKCAPVYEVGFEETENGILYNVNFYPKPDSFAFNKTDTVDEILKMVGMQLPEILKVIC